MTDGIFIAIGIFTLLCGSSVILCKSPVYSAFSLILSFFGLAGLYILLESPFIAVIQVLVYTGAIVVLFVYVVMLMNPNSSGAYRNWIFMIVSAFLAWAVSLYLLKALTLGVAPAVGGAHALSLKEVATLLFTKYLWPFEILSIFLVVMIVAVFALAKQSKETPNE